MVDRWKQVPGFMQACPDGDFVEYTNYAALGAERDETIRELRETLEMGDKTSKRSQDMMCDFDMTGGGDEFRTIGRKVVKAHECHWCHREIQPGERSCTIMRYDGGHKATTKICAEIL